MINILHLYYDLMNLYGENGNVRALKQELVRNKVKVKVDLKSINDKFDINKYDIIYIGSGSEYNLTLALEDLIKRSEQIKTYIKNNKYLFLTGNAIEMFGKYIKTDKGIIKACDIFSFHTDYLASNSFKNASNGRIVGETISKCDIIKEVIIGFQNRYGVLHNVKKPFLRTNPNYSNDLKTIDEGFHYKNVYATYNIGPLFIRNPYLLEYLIKDILKSKKKKYTAEKNSISKNAYNKFIQNIKI